MQFFTKFYKKIPPKKIGGIGCINIDNEDIRRLRDGNTLTLSYCGSVDGQSANYVVYNPADKNLDVEYVIGGNDTTVCSDNSIKITKDSAFSFMTIESCYIPKDNEIHDASGTYIFTNDCYYQR